MTITEFALLLSSIGGVTTPVVVVMLSRQNKKIEEVHRSTNGMAERNEAIAKKLGIAEGTAAGLKEGREEGK